MSPAPAFVNVCPAAVILPIVNKLEAVPKAEKVVTVVVLAAVNLIVCGVASCCLKSVKVFDPTKSTSPVLVALVIHIFPNVFPPPLKVLTLVVEPEILIVLVLGVRVRLVAVAVVQTVEVVVAVSSHVPVPIKIVRTFELDELNKPIVKLLLFASSVPLVRVTARVAPTVRASASCHVPPTPLKVTAASIVFPLVVMVLVPEVAANVQVGAPLKVKVVVAEIFKLPYIEIELEPLAQVPEKPVRSMLPT